MEALPDHRGKDSWGDFQGGGRPFHHLFLQALFQVLLGNLHCNSMLVHFICQFTRSQNAQVFGSILFWGVQELVLDSGNVWIGGLSGAKGPSQCVGPQSCLSVAGLTKAKDRKERNCFLCPTASELTTGLEITPL